MESRTGRREGDQRKTGERFRWGVVLTGGIGTGKSSVASLLKLYGYRVIDADQIAREVFQRKREEIGQLFGTTDRRELRRLVFRDPAQLRRLEQLLLPEIREELFRRARREEERETPYFVEIPLYFEKGGRQGPYRPFPRVVVVYAPREVQIERVVARDRSSREEVEQILAQQVDIEQKRKLADFVVVNSGGLKELQRQVEELIQWVEQELPAEVREGRGYER